MEYSNFLKNISGTACVIGLAISSMNINGTMVVDGNYQMPSAHYAAIDDVTSSNVRIDSNNYYTKENTSRLENEARRIFGTMRDADADEKESVNSYIKGISKDTGVNFFDLC